MREGSFVQYQITASLLPLGNIWDCDEQFHGNSVKEYAMFDTTFPIEFIGGSRDGEVIEATAAPDYYEVAIGTELKEIYERRTSEPPFVYVQIGYAGNETWK